MLFMKQYVVTRKKEQMSDIADVTQERQDRMMNEFLNRIIRIEKPVEILQRDCIDCGETIPLQRLKALPHCVRCVNCQGKTENDRSFRNY